MGIRARLVLAMGFVVVTVVVSLTVPLWINLSERTQAELENRNLVRAESIAQRFGAASFLPQNETVVASLVATFAAQVDGRVLVVDAEGRVVADSDGVARGTMYATTGRPEIIGALGGTPTSETRYSTDLGEDLMATAVPIIQPPVGARPSRVIGAVRITQSLAEASRNLRATTLGLVAVGLGSLAAGLILAVALATSVARPMRELTDASRRFGDGDLDARSGAVRGAPELRRLAGEFDTMAERIARSVRAQREFVGNASHQLRTPLTGMKLQLEGAMASTDDPDLRQQLAAADREVDRLTAIVARLLATARGEEAGADTVDAVAAASRSVARWRDRAAAATATLELEVPLDPGAGAIHVRCNAEDLEQVLDNLIDNALTYGRSPVRLRVVADAERATLAVIDAGPGIAPADLEFVTDRFYRGSGVAPGGSGLGLAIAKEIAERHGGTLEVTSGDTGTTVAMRLPLAATGSVRPPD